MAESNDPSPCSACGWTSQKQHRCSYMSSVKLFYGTDARGVWSIGTDFVLKERPADPPTYEAANTQFLHAHTSIPVPAIAKDWVDKDGRQFIMVDRVEGQELQTAWPMLSQDEKVRIAEQTAYFVQQLRKLQFDKMASIGDQPLYGGWLLLQEGISPYGPFTSDDQLWQALVRTLEKIPDKAKDAFRKRLPPCSPYTFTHGDLSTANIIVKDGNLAAIIDWEWAGYFPVWWEYTSLGITQGGEDREWKTLLESKMQPFKDGREFWQDFRLLSRYPDLDGGAKYFVEELLQE